MLSLSGGGSEKVSLKKVETLHLFCEILKRNVQIGKHTVIIIDEAHLIEDTRTFEELRVLLNYVVDNKFTLTIILMGQTELREKLALLPQFKQRVNYHYHIQNLDLEEVGEYIKHRLLVAGHPTGELFCKYAVEEIYDTTQGLPRSINNLCDVCLMIGFDKGLDKIHKEVVLEAKKEVLM
jgi:general secretion pathway protein A